MAGPTLCCEALLSEADVGWVLRYTGQLKLCYNIIHSKGKLCCCINTRQLFSLISFKEIFEVTSWEKCQHQSLSVYLYTSPTKAKGVSSF